MTTTENGVITQGDGFRVERRGGWYDAYSVLITDEHEEIRLISMPSDCEVTALKDESGLVRLWWVEPDYDVDVIDVEVERLCDVYGTRDIDLQMLEDARRKAGADRVYGWENLDDVQPVKGDQLTRLVETGRCGMLFSTSAYMPERPASIAYLDALMFFDDYRAVVREDVYRVFGVVVDLQAGVSDWSVSNTIYGPWDSVELEYEVAEVLSAAELGIK